MMKLGDLFFIYVTYVLAALLAYEHGYSWWLLVVIFPGVALGLNTLHMILMRKKEKK